MQNIEPSIQTISDTRNQRHWMEWAEYASLVGSAVGTFFATVSGQVVFAAAPLTVALTLNMANRYRYEEQTEQNTKAAIADVRQVVQSLYTTLPGRSLPTADLKPMHEALSQLQNLTQRLDSKAVGEEDWGTVNVRLLLLEEAIANLRQSPFKGGSDESLGMSDELEEKLNTSDSQHSEGRNSIADVQQRIAQLEQQQREIVKPYLIRLTRSVKHLKHTEAIADIREELDALNLKFHRRPEQEQIEELRSALARLSGEFPQFKDEG